MPRADWTANWKVERLEKNSDMSSEYQMVADLAETMASQWADWTKYMSESQRVCQMAGLRGSPTVDLKAAWRDERMERLQVEHWAATRVEKLVDSLDEMMVVMKDQRMVETKAGLLEVLMVAQTAERSESRQVDHWEVRKVGNWAVPLDVLMAGWKG